MKMRLLVAFTMLAMISLTALPAADKTETLEQRAARLHKDALVIDTHCDTPMAMLRGLDIGAGNNRNDVDLGRMEAGGVDAMFFAVFVSNARDRSHPARHTLEMIDAIVTQVEANSKRAALAVSTADILRLHEEGRRAILMGMENGGPLEGSLRLLRQYYRLGVRYITLTHNSHNDICDSSTAAPAAWNGLSRFGGRVVEEMNRLGMIIDISHVSDATFYDVLRLSKAPVMASHSCVRAICDTPRNMSDDMIRALARHGGVIQINFYSAFLDPGYSRRAREVQKALAPRFAALRAKHGDGNAFWKAAFALWKKHTPEPPGLEILIDHIDHVAKLVGVRHVGLGSDFDGAGSFPRGLEDVSGFPRITLALLKRGYTEEDVRLILGGNFMRVFSEVERVAAKLKREV